MREQLLHRCDPFRLVTVPRKRRGHHFEEVFGVTEEKIVLVPKMRVESGAAHLRAVEHILHSDVVERFLDKQRHHRISEAIARAANALVFLFIQFRQVSEHERLFCSISFRTNAGRLTNASLKLNA